MKQGSYHPPLYQPASPDISATFPAVEIGPRMVHGSEFLQATLIKDQHPLPSSLLWWLC